MDIAAAVKHQLKYGTTAASLEAQDKARVQDVLARMLLTEKKRAADREKRESKKELAAAAAADAAVILDTIPVTVPGSKKKRGKKAKDEVYQTVADTQRANRNAAGGRHYCQHEVELHQKLLAEEIKQNKNKVLQLNLHEMELIKSTHDHALHIINECQSMSLERKTQVKEYLEQDKKNQETAAELRSNKTARVLVNQQNIHKGHFQAEDNINTDLCEKKTVLTKEYNEKKQAAFSSADFTHIVNFTRLDKSNFNGESHDIPKTIYKNHKMHVGIPAGRARTYGG